MPFAVACPKCKTDYQVPDQLRDKPIGCRKCEFLFRAHPAGPKQNPTPQPALLEQGVPPDRQGDPTVQRDASTESKSPPTAAAHPTARRRRRPITWAELEQKKRLRNPDDEQQSPARQEPAAPTAPPLLAPRHRGRWIAIGALILLAAGGTGLGAYHLFKPRQISRPQAVADLPPTLPPVEEPGRAAPEGDLPIQPIPLEGDSATIELGEEIEELALGGGGRFVVLKMAASHELRIFDVNRLKIAKAIPVEAGARFAAGARKLVVSNERRGVLQRWDFFQERWDLEVPLIENQVVKALVMGGASDGPLLEVYAESKQAKGLLRFRDLETLTETTMRNLPAEGFEDCSYRASEDGRVVAYSSKLGSGLANGVLLVEGDEVRQVVSKTGPLAPAADGRFIYTPQGRATPELKFVQSIADPGGFVAPAVQGGYFLNIAAKEATAPKSVPGKRIPNRVCRFTLRSTSNTPLAAPIEIPFPLPARPSGDDPIDVDHRALWIPDAKIIVVVPSSTDRLILYRCDLENRMTDLDPDYLVVTSAAPPEFRRGRIYAYPLEVLSKHGGLKYAIVSGPEGMKINKEGLLTWSVPVDFARLELGVQLEVSDSAGRKLAHSFRLALDDSTPAEIPFDGKKK